MKIGNPDEQKIKAAEARYLKASHAMQSGVMVEESMGDKSLTNKHLRVGINSSMVEHGALVALLLRKRVFTELEYIETLADAMEAEVASYEDRIASHIGRRVKLG